jgi:hypothetical protein
VPARSLRGHVGSTARDRIEDVQPVLDILDRAIVRKLIEELTHELLGRDRCHEWTIA